ncbi:RNA-dependent RNA polymerase [Helicobasidium mompa totivirus 1-17]|uniref:RNA-directed RNA polymerase n=1 Tax=Helicobasidium mompa totivirus 1-17 TaxID=196690 RepID=Q76L27_9VIRU|nr:RNA-dependent RNA polymerase [Helicobasidium mompa totivirus 1-17]BAC81754.1 RNA-dependent RNA polymerase [Helicobasidium mompa totivirus 1-17]
MKALRAAQDKAGELGPLGSALLERVLAKPEVFERVSRGNIEEQNMEVANLQENGMGVDAAAFLSSLSFPIQVKLNQADIITLARLATDTRAYCPLINRTLDTAVARKAGVRSAWTEREGHRLLNNVIGDVNVRKSTVPSEATPAATIKANLSLGRTLLCAPKVLGHSIIARIVWNMAGKCSSDVITAAILYTAALLPSHRNRSWRIAVAACLDPKAAKGLSTAMKSLGANSVQEGAVLVEAQSLQGRMTGACDLAEEASYRCDARKVAEQVISADPEALRDSIRWVLNKELANGVDEYQSLDDFWSRRWLWCVNGSHTNASDAKVGIRRKVDLPGIDRVYRRMVAEALEEEPISCWDGTTFVSATQKLEHGKTRAIFACDTQNYFRVSHLLGPVQNRWRNERILLDPGEGGSLKMAHRMMDMRAAGGLNVMLDYDDFNSHHATETQKILFEELIKHVNYDPVLGKTLVDSFDKMYCYIKGVRVGQVLGTMMSGHRGTMFINSVLNAVYIRLATGAAFFDPLSSLHAGDDVYAVLPSLSDAKFLLDSCHNFGCRMNSTKQSVGVVCGEFLRMAVTPVGAIGYVCRSIASFISGNWSTDAPLTPREYLTNCISQCHTLFNRSNSMHLIQLISDCIHKRLNLKRKLCLEMMTGLAAPDGVPLFNTMYGRVYPIVPENWRRRGARFDCACEVHHATSQYSSQHLPPVKVEALTETGTSAASAMQLASYKRAIDSMLSYEPRKVKFGKPRTMNALGLNLAKELFTHLLNTGCLEAMPVLRLIQDQIKRPLLRELVLLAGGDGGAADLEVEAWGPQTRKCSFFGWIPYSDAAALQKKADHIKIMNHTPVRM